MTDFDSLSPDEQMERIHELARTALDHFDMPRDCSVKMVNHSENVTYKVESPSTGERRALRVHREGYHSRTAIESELTWVQALREEAGIHAPLPHHGRNGEFVQEVASEGVPRSRHVVMFEWLDGDKPDETGDLRKPFERLGEISARMHNHAATWRRPSFFTRLTWNYDTTIGDNSHWGRWQDGFGITPGREQLFERLRKTISQRLDRFGRDESRFGLVHADIRMDNLLTYGDDTRVLDFDDCGFSWFLYDCATALSFIEARDDANDLVAHWVKGYRTLRDLPAEDEAEIPTFVMLRRLLLVAWIGSHSETDLAQEMGVDFTKDTVDLAERYLSRFG